MCIYIYISCNIMKSNNPNFSEYFLFLDSSLTKCISYIIIVKHVRCEVYNNYVIKLGHITRTYMYDFIT